MDPLNDLASAASQARPYLRRRVVAKGKRQTSSTPLVVGIVAGGLLIGGAILFAALHSGGAAAAPGADQQSSSEQAVPSDVDPNPNPVQRADFQAFVRRMCTALALQHKTALQAENASGEMVVNYKCDYKLGSITARRAGNGHPAAFIVKYSGTVDGNGQNYFSNETSEIVAAFVPSADGKWAVDSATERMLTRKTSADFMGAGEKGGPARDISHTDWFHYAVNDALKQASGNG